MIRKKIGIIGIGTIGEAFLSELNKNIGFIKKNLELDVEIAKIADCNPKIRAKASKIKVPFTKNAEEIIEDENIDIVVELIGGINPAKKYIVDSFKNGKDVVTANKALLASYGKDIFGLAYKYGRAIGFEAAVAGGIPIIKSVAEVLRFGEIRNLYGILNGTTNFILTQMEKEAKTYKESLQDAKKCGIAERDPSLDLSGKDALHKICLLCFLCFGRFPKLSEILTEGIEKLTVQDIVYARELGFTVKLLAVAKKDKKIETRVHPALVPQDHPLAKTNGVLNSVFVDTGIGGDFFFSGLGAGGNPTALSVMSDVITACGQKKFYSLREAKEKYSFKKSKDFDFRYYLRFSALDKPGVLAKISRVLSDYKISIASVSQKETPLNKKQNRFVPIVMITHRATEENVDKALKRINRLSIIKSPTQLIRIEGLCV